MATNAGKWAVGNVDCQRYLIRNFLEDYIIVDVLQHILLLLLTKFCIESSSSLCLARLREVADAFHIANHSGQIIKILAVAVRALFEVAFVYMTTLVANRIRNVKREIVAPFLRSHT